MVTHCKTVLWSHHIYIVPLVIDYNPNTPNIAGIIRNNLQMLHSTSLMREIFPDGCVIPAYRRPKNLKELIASSKYKSHRTTINKENTQSGCFKCHKKMWLTLQLSFRVCFFHVLSLVKHITLRNLQLSCNSRNIVYLASCNKCSLQYVGCTTTSFKVRFRNSNLHMKST